MNNNMSQEKIFLNKIGEVRCPMTEKFGLPRQSNLAEDLRGTVVFEKEYSVPEAFEGLEDYEYIWIIWGFDGIGEKEGTFRPRVRPPRLGGNEFVGVFSTRSPFRPNHIGLSCVRLESVEITDKGTVLHISGLDMRDKTPVYDIKPYLPYVEAHPGARGGFTDKVGKHRLEVVFENTVSDLAEGDIKAITELISQDPRPAYQDDPQRIYGMKYGGVNVKFRVEGNKAIVVAAEKEGNVFG